MHLGFLVGLESLLGRFRVHMKSFRRRTVVILMPRHHVPRRGQGDETNKHNYGIVHAFAGNGNGRWHAEQGDGQETPCCAKLDACRKRDTDEEDLPMHTRLQKTPK